MPASRSARAITLAPRSCPSSPGFATSTRILRSVIVLHLITVGDGYAWSSNADELKRFRIQASPQIPAGHAAIRLPAFCNLLHLGRSWQLNCFFSRLLARDDFLGSLGDGEVAFVHRYVDS